MKYDSKIVFSNMDFGLSNAIEDTMEAYEKANADISSASAADVSQKRGFNYTGDGGWGLNGHGRSFVDGLGRIPEGFCLQPFGIGTQNLWSQSLTPSIFDDKGARVKFTKTTRLAHVKMAMAVEAYKGFGIIKNVIDLMCNFASEGVKVIHPRPAVQKFYERWFEATDIQGRVKDILRYYYKYGNVFIYTSNGKIDATTYNKMKKSVGKDEEGISKDSDIKDVNNPHEVEKFSDRQIPWRYTLLNPFQMDIVGTKYFGESRWVFIPDIETSEEIKRKDIYKYDTTDVLDETKVNLPPEFKKANKKKDYIPLDPMKLATLHYMKDDHEDWADPMVWPVMNDVLYKQQLRSMDMSVTNSIINAITIFKLGSIKDGYVATEKQVKKLAEMLRTPTYSHNIVWNDAISMETSYPPVDKILSQDKYKSVDRDILAGLGVPSILVSGSEGGSFSNAFLQVRALLERLEDGRNAVMRWLNAQLRLVARTMGHREIPTVKFGHMSLRDEQAEKQLIVQLLDRNIISAERVHEIFDVETNIEIERLRREKELSEKEGVFTKFGPFREPMNMMDQEETMELQKDLEVEKQREINKMAKPTDGPNQRNRPSQSPLHVRKNGRPSGTKGIPHKKKRDTKPTGMGMGAIDAAKIRAIAEDAFLMVEAAVTKRMLDARGVKYKKQLSRKDKLDLENLVSLVYINSNPLELSSASIEASLDLSTLDSSYVSLLNSFKERMPSSTISERRAISITTMTHILMENDNE